MGASNTKNVKQNVETNKYLVISPKPINCDSKGNQKSFQAIKTLKKTDETNDINYMYLAQETGISQNEIKNLLIEFNLDNPDGKLDKSEFTILYSKLRPEPAQSLTKIAEFVFKSFDRNKDGFISLNEFIVGFTLSTRGDLKRKLDYLFKIYDIDDDGFITLEEIESVIIAMLELLRSSNSVDIKSLSKECIQHLDKDSDGKVTKKEFVQELTQNYRLRALMSPFN